jgi:hypothetical protein
VPNPTIRTPRANHPAHEKALVALWLAIDACNEFLDAHRAALPGPEHACPRVSGRRCEACSLRDLYTDLSGILYSLEVFAGRLEDQARPFPEQLERLAQEWRDQDVPQAEQILRAVQCMGARGPTRGRDPEPTPDGICPSDLYR